MYEGVIILSARVVKKEVGVRCTLSDLLIISINGPALEVGESNPRSPRQLEH